MARGISFRHSVVSMPPLMPPAPHTISHDADVNERGEVVLATQAANGIDVHFLATGATHRFPQWLRYPGVRWIDDSRVVLFDSRMQKDSPNAWIIDPAGNIKVAFSIGDAVEDVVRTEKYLVVTYFDEGVFGYIPLSKNGIAVFTHGGRYLWGWNSSMPPDSPNVDDCYAAGCAGGDTVGVLIYTAFHGAAYAFGILDVEKRFVALYDVPESLHRTRALAGITDGTWLFALRSSEGERLVSWRPGSAEYETVTPPAPLAHGLPDGRFMTVTDRSAGVVNVSIEASRAECASARLAAQVLFFDRL